MNREDLLVKVAAFLREHAEEELEKCDENCQLQGDLGFNSLDLMNIVNDAEDEFDIVIEDEDMDKIVTVGDVVNLIAQKKGM